MEGLIAFLLEFSPLLKEQRAQRHLRSPNCFSAFQGSDLRMWASHLENVTQSTFERVFMLGSEGQVPAPAPTFIVQ